MRLLVAVVVLAVTGEALAAPPVLDGIEVVGTHATAVRLHLSGPALAQARSLAPSGDAPDRIYVDLGGTILAPTLSRLVNGTGTGSLLRVRAGQFDRATVRVVLDLAGALPFTLHQTEQTVTIELGPRALSAPPETPKTSRPPVAAAARPVEIARGAPLSPAAPIAQPKKTSPPAVPAPAEAATTANVPAPPPPRPAGERPAAPPASAHPPAAAQAHPTAVSDNVHGGDRAAATMPAPIPAAPPAETASARPAAPAEHREPASATPTVPEPEAEPTPQAPVPPPALPALFPSMSALPGALVALQNGRELDRHAPGSVPPSPERAPPPTAAPPPTTIPTSLAAAVPSSSPPERQAPVPSLVGPPSPPAGPPEPTRTARAVAPPPAEHSGSRSVPPPAERPRTPAAAVTASSRPATRPPHPLIVLDAGHGGRDPGAEGVGGVLEKDVVLEITQLVARRLAARLPVDVLMTRSDDSFIPIERRLALPGEGATLFISLHANACTDPTARGLEVFYGGGEVRTASTHGGNGPAALLGRSLNKALEARIGGVRGGARPGAFGVLVRNPVPSALIEIGYLTHPGEAARAQDTGFHELLADAVVEGVSAFLRASALDSDPGLTLCPSAGKV